MADMNELYSALLKADAAGDTESAKALADYIRSQPVAPAQSPIGAIGTGIADFAKMIGGSAISGTASVPAGLEQGIKGLARQSMEGKPEMVMPSSVYQPGFDTEETLFGPETAEQKARRELNAQRAVASMPSIPGAKYLSQVGREAQKNIEETLSPETKQALKDSQVTGNVFKGEIDFGKDPSVRGYAMQTASVFGSMAPIVLTAIATRNPMVGGVLGGGMAADEAGQSAAKFIATKSHEQLMAESPFYAQMVAGGANPKEARDLTVKKAAETGAALQGIVALGGDTFTGKLVTGAFEKMLTQVAGKSMLGKTAAGVGLSSAEQALSETAEGVASDIGTASVVPSKEVGEDSAANLILGALGGTGPGVLSGLAGQKTPPAGPAAAKGIMDLLQQAEEKKLQQAQADTDAKLAAAQAKAEAPAPEAGLASLAKVPTEPVEAPTPAVAEAPTPVPVEDENAPAQDLEAMLRELEGQTQAIEKQRAPVTVNDLAKMVTPQQEETPVEAPKPVAAAPVAEVPRRSREQQEAGQREYAAAVKGSGMMPINDYDGNYAVPLSLFKGLDLDTRIPLFGNQTLDTVIKRGGIGINEAVALLEGNDKALRRVTEEDRAKYPELFGQPATQTKPAGPTVVNEGSIGAAVAKTKAKTKAQQDEDLLNDLLGGGDSSLSARRTDKQISIDEQANEMGKRYGLTRNKGEDIKAFGARLKNAIEFEKKREVQEAEGAPALSGMTDQELAGQELKKESTYQPSKDQIEAYEENREYYNENLEEGDEPLPAYKELSPDDRLVYFQENIPLGSRGSAAQHRAALQQLADFRSGVKEETGPYQVKDRETGELLFNEDGSPMMVASPYPGETRARGIYNEARDEFSRKTGLSYAFPAWTGLSSESKKLFIDINKTNTALERDMAFRAVKKQIQADKAAEASKGNTIQAETDARREMLAAAERARKSQPGGKVKEGQTEEEARGGDILPDNILEALLNGDIQKVLAYISEYGNGVSLTKASDFFLTGAKKNKAGRVQPIFKKKIFHIRNSIAMGVFRSLANTLGNIDGLKVNVVYDSNMIYDQLARYDANSNTLYFGPNGLNEATILHELTHAATVKIIHQFYTDATKLAPHTKVAVEQLIRIASAAKARLGSKHPNAFENLYEFIAYAMTDADFQYDLAQQQVSSLATATNKLDEKGRPIDQAEELQIERESTRGETRYDGLMDNLWNSFTGTLAYMYKLFTPGAKKTAVLLPTEKSGYARVRTAEEKEAGEALEKAARGERRERTKELSLAEKEALSPEKLFDGLDEDEKEEASIPSAPRDYTTAYGVSNLQRSILREPGYKGNFLLEAAEMFQLIVAAPEGGIEQLAGKNSLGAELSATKQPKPPKKAANLHKAELGVDNTEYHTPKEDVPPTIKERFNRMRGNINTWRNLARMFQDDRYRIKAHDRILDMSGKLIRDGKNQMNNVYEQIVLAVGDGKNFFNKYVQEPARELDEAVKAFSDATGYKTKRAIEELHKILEAVHEPERRMVKYLLSVPLSTKDNLMHNGKKISAATRRADIVKLLDTQTITPAQAQQLRDELNSIVFEKDASGQLVRDPEGNPKPNMTYVDPAGSTPKPRSTKGPDIKRKIDYTSEAYTATGMNLADAKKIRDDLKNYPHAAEVQKVMDSIQQLHLATTELNKLANYWSQPVSNRVAFYGFENYVPLKGNPKHSDVDEDIDFDSQRNGRELQDRTGAMEGRTSVSKNPILQTMTDATRASLRAGRRNLTQAIKNSLKKDKDLNPYGQGTIAGYVKKTIKFEERDTVDLSDLKGETTIFHYNEDGSIDVLVVADQNLRDSIRRTYKRSSPLTEFANKLTSGIGQMHTRYNYNFAPMNFVRDALTNTWNIGASELGPVEAARYLANVAMLTANGGMYKAMQVAILYPKGDIKSMRALETLAKKDPYIRDMVEYIRQGGMVSHLNGMSLESNFQELHKKVGTSGILKTVEDINQVADVWTNMFELASRASAYSVAKNRFIHTDKLSEAEARTKAAVFTKNLANFEQVGEWGKAMGAAYMFFRPAATGAVRAIEAVAPAFTSVESAVKRLPPDIEQDAKAKAEYIKNYEKLQRNARVMSGALFGLGVLAYTMAYMTADDDDLGRNAVATDNMEQWTRFARFHVPRSISEAMGLKDPLIFQIPWGFGLGSFAAAGAQLAGVVGGSQKITEALPNIFISVALDSFVPVPVSRIPITESPFNWFLDSIAPSTIRPILEFTMNKNGLGRDINSTAQRRMGDAYTGGDNIPELWKDVARFSHDVTDGYLDVSPNTLYFLTNSYVDGVSRIGEAAYGINDVAAGRKDFSPKTDLPLFGSFFGSRSSVDAREFARVEKEIQHMEKVINDFKTQPEKYAEYTAKYPLDEAVVEIYNKMINQELNPLRADDKTIRLDRNLTPADRKSLLLVNKFQEDLVKRQMIDVFKTYGVEP